MRVGAVVGGENTHVIAGFARNLASRDRILTMVELMQSRNDLYVEVAYASSNEMRVMNRFCELVSESIYHIRNGVQCCPVVFTPTGQEVTARDVNRNFTNIGVGATNANLVLLTDIYALGDRPYTPADLAALFPTARHILHLRHSFPGEMGRSAESAWVARGDRIWWQADRGEEPYVHDRNSWELVSGCSNGLAWATRFHKEYDNGEPANCLIHLTRSQRPLAPGMEIRDTTYQWLTYHDGTEGFLGDLSVTMHNAAVDYFGHGDHRFHGSEVELLVPRSYLNAISGLYRAGVITVNSLDVLARKAANAVAKDALLQDMLDRDPTIDGKPVFPPDYVQCLATAGFQHLWHLRAADVRRCNQMATSVLHLNTAQRGFGRAELPNAPAVGLAKQALRYSAVALTVAAAWYFSPGEYAPGTSLLLPCVVAPLVEESVKRAVGAVSHPIIAAAGFGVAEVLFRSQSGHVAVGTVAAHTLLGYLSGPCAFVAHSLFNWAVVRAGQLAPTEGFLSIFQRPTLTALTDPRRLLVFVLAVVIAVAARSATGARLLRRVRTVLTAMVAPYGRRIRDYAKRFGIPTRTFPYPDDPEQPDLQTATPSQIVGPAVSLYDSDILPASPAMPTPEPVPQPEPEVCTTSAAAIPGELPGAEQPSQDIWDEALMLLQQLEEEGLSLRDPQLADRLVVSGPNRLSDNMVCAVNTLRPLPSWGLHDINGRVLNGVKADRAELEEFYNDHVAAGDFKVRDVVGYYEVIGTGIPWLRFAPTTVNMIGMVAHKKFFQTVLTCREQIAAFAPVEAFTRNYILRLFRPPEIPFTRDSVLRTGLDHAKKTSSWQAHKARMAEAPHLWGNVDAAQQLVTCANLHGKGDEVLGKGTPATVTCRPIDDCTLEATHGLLPWIYTLAAEVYKQANNGVVQIPHAQLGRVTWHIRLVKCFNPDEFSAEVESFCRTITVTTSVLLYCAGDDMYSCIRTKDKVTVYISDLSKCDQSMNTAPLKLQHMIFQHVAAGCAEMAQALSFCLEMNSFPQRTKPLKDYGSLRITHCTEHPV
jgi:hypothetical protein